MQPSVDAFLENRPEFLEVGKAAMACALIPYEHEPRLYRISQEMRWYEYLFLKMSAKLEEFRENELSIITFNYDRSLEHFLYLALKNSYGVPDEVYTSHLQNIPIVHVYGKLGELPYIHTRGRAYDPTVNTDIVNQCVAAIRIIQEGKEDINKEPQFMKAHELMRDAEIICFLGFGYHKTNVGRLRFDRLPEKKQVLGSAYGIGEGERPPIQRLFLQRIQLGFEHHDVLTFLRHNPIFK